MSQALFFNMVKAQSRNMLSYGVGMALYLLLVVSMYPSFAGSPALNSLLKSLPPGLLRLVGYQGGISQVGDYLAGEFYTLIYVIILAIYAVTAATRLMAHLVDGGPMAYLLATPVSRLRIALTQASVLVCGIVVIGVLATMSGLLGVRWLVPNSSLPVQHFLEMNLVGTLLFLVIAAYSFLFSVLNSDERTAISLSGGVTVVFYALNLLGTLTNKYDWMRRLSLFSLFDPQQLMRGNAHFAAESLALAATALILFALAVLVFRRRDLSL